MNDNSTNTSPPQEFETQTARPVAPEDLRPGDYVAALQIVSERVWPMFGLDEKPPRLIHVVHWPRHNWQPMRVEELCLPFVLLATPRGKHCVIDVRQYRLGRVSASFGRRLFEVMGAAEEREKAATPEDAPTSSE